MSELTQILEAIEGGNVQAASELLPLLCQEPRRQECYIVWATNAAGFSLKSTTKFSIPNSWPAVAQLPMTNAGQISVIVPLTMGAEFFQLESQ